MNAKTEAELRQRIIDYRRRGAMTWHEGVREAITKVTAEAEERLRQLEVSSRPDRQGGSRGGGRQPTEITETLT